jgi:hypothetical protein
LLKMWSSIGVFVNLRPAKVLPQLLDARAQKRKVVEGVDIMVVRDLTGDVYFGEPKGIKVRDGECANGGSALPRGASQGECAVGLKRGVPATGVLRSLRPGCAMEEACPRSWWPRSCRRA